MEELRRVLREQDGKEKKKGRKKGKEKKVEGEVMFPEEKAEKARVCLMDPLPVTSADIQA